MTGAHVDQLRTVYEHWSQGDFRTDASMFSSDFEWRQSVDAVEPAIHHGSEGAAQMARGVFEVFENVRIIPIEFVDAGERVVVVSRVRGKARGTGIELNRPYVQVWTFRRGKPVMVEDYPERQDALRAVGPGGKSDPG